MNYNLSDPNLDFDIEQEAIINALKGARTDRQAEAPGFKTPAHWTARSGPLGGIGAAFTRLAGGLNERMAMDENRALSGEQRNRVDALQRELATPAPTSRTVLKQALQAGPTEEGGSLPDIQTQTQEQIPENEYRLAENQRRMGVAQQMSRLPMARGMADELWKKGIAFPEKMMELEAKQIEAGQRAAQTAADKEAQALRDEQLRRDIAAQSSADRRYMADQSSADRRYMVDSKGPSAADLKRQDALTNNKKASDRFGSLADNFSAQVDILDKGMGVTSTDNRVGSNLGAWASNTGPGQLVGKMFSTENQSARNKMKLYAGNMLLELKALKDLPASMMNSNMELQQNLANIAGGDNVDAGTLRESVRLAKELVSANKVEADKAIESEDTPSVGGAPKTKLYQGVTYVQKPGTTGKNKSDWIPQ